MSDSFASSRRRRGAITRHAAVGAIALAAAAAGPAAASAATQSLSLSVSQRPASPGQLHTAGRSTTRSNQLDVGTFADGPTMRGGVATLITTRTTRYRKHHHRRYRVRISGTTAVVFSAKRRGLCVHFDARSPRVAKPPRGSFSMLSGTGASAGYAGSGSYRRAKRRGAAITTLSGKLTPASTGPPGPVCRQLLARAAALRPVPSIAAAGDISCPGGDSPTPVSCQQGATSDLILDPLAAVLALGDNQYNHGTFTEYTIGANSFDNTWGRVKPIIYPTPGNHEYLDPAGRAAGYFRYFQSGAARSPGTPGHGWYSFDVASWHVLSIDANCGVTPGDLGAGGCATGSPQERWVRNDLAANSKTAPGGPRCILAFWHEPLYTSGGSGSSNPAMRAIWQDLLNAHADVVLAGHQHDYERFAPQDANGHATASGIAELVVGTGGEDHEVSSLPRAPNSVVENDSSFGVLRMTLRPGRYDWRFVPIGSSSFGDSGSAACH